MFERYTERARRVIFFARYEASQLGSTTIESEHMLLGLIREDKNLTNRFLHNSAPVERIRSEIEARTGIRDKVSTSIDLPLTEECKHILARAAEEASGLGHRHIGTEHLLLGILGEENCVAAGILTGRGLRLDTIREELARSAANRGGPDEPASSQRLESFRFPGLQGERMVPDETAAKRIAEAVWTPVYGGETVRSQNPLNANLRMHIWFVTGSELPNSNEGKLFALIQATDGRILSVGRQSKEPHV